MTLDELLAREGIRKTLAAYTAAGDRLKTGDFIKVFTEDGIIETEPQDSANKFRYQGREAIGAWMDRWRAPGAAVHTSRFIRHHLSTCHIELTGAESASTRTYWVAYTSIGPDHCGYYLDAFRKVGDEWLIAHRRIRDDWTREDSLYHESVSRTAG